MYRERQKNIYRRKRKRNMYIEGQRERERGNMYLGREREREKP